MKIINPPEEMSTERLNLRRLQHSDAENIFQFAQKETNTRYMAWKRHQTIEDSKDFLDYSIKAFESGEEYSYGIELKDKTFVGWIGLHVLLEDTAYIGFLIGEKYWNSGYASEAAAHIFNWLKEQPNIKTITSCCHIDNTASKRVLEKTGFILKETKAAWHPFPNLGEGKYDAFYFEFEKE